MKKIAILVFSLLISGLAFAEAEMETNLVENTDNSQQIRVRETKNNYSLGVGFVYSDTLYKSDKNDFLVLPNIGVRYENFYIRGVRPGIFLLENKDYEITLFIDPVSRFRVKGSDMREGYKNIDDRENKVTFGGDITIRSLDRNIIPSLNYKVGNEGWESDLVISRPTMIKPGLFLVPQLAASVYSRDTIKYFFGVSEDEVNRSSTDNLNEVYEGGIAYSYGARVALEYNYTRNLIFSGIIGVQRFSSEFRNSPIVDKRSVLVGGAGIRYRF